MKNLYENCGKIKKISKIFEMVLKNFENIKRNFQENFEKT